MHGRLVMKLLSSAQVASYAVRDIEEYKNFCDRPKNQRPQPEEIVGVLLF